MIAKYGERIGNHVHLELFGVVGIDDFDVVHAIEWNRVLRLSKPPVDENAWDYVETRRKLVNSVILSSLIAKAKKR